MNSNNELSSFKWFHHQNLTKKNYQNESLLAISQRLPGFSPINLLTSVPLLNYFRDGDFYVTEINQLDSNHANAKTLNNKNSKSNEQQVGKFKLNTINSSHSLPDLSNKINKTSNKNSVETNYQAKYHLNVYSKNNWIKTEIFEQSTSTTSLSNVSSTATIARNKGNKEKRSLLYSAFTNFKSSSRGSESSQQNHKVLIARNYFISENDYKKFDSLEKLIDFYSSNQNAEIKLKNSGETLRLINGISIEDFFRINKHIDEETKKRKEFFRQQTKNVSAPSKPVRTPTIKLNKKQSSDMNSNLNKANTTTTKDVSSLQENQIEINSSKFDNEIDLNETTTNIALNIKNDFDINAPNLRIISLIDLNSYECSIIKDRSKHLDRLALIEANQLLLINANSNILSNCCKICLNLINSFNTASLSLSQSLVAKETNSLAIHLAKCFTYQDLKYLRFNIDFGLGIFTGLELMMLPQGEQIRLDIIERYNSSSLFLVLMIVLCQNKNDRINLIVNLLDCAFYLFEKLRNLFAFSYVMEAFNSKHVERLTETWALLKENNEFKYNLFKNLNEKYANMLKGDFYHIEQEALLPSIYQIALLMTNESLSIKETPMIYNDYETYLNLAELYLSVNARYYLKNSTKYALKCEMFIQNEYGNIFYHLENRALNKMCHLNLSSKFVYLSQTEFHQIVLWSSEYKIKNNNDHSSSTLVNLSSRISQIDEVLRILSFKIQPQQL